MTFAVRNNFPGYPDHVRLKKRYSRAEWLRECLRAGWAAAGMIKQCVQTSVAGRMPQAEGRGQWAVGSGQWAVAGRMPAPQVARTGSAEFSRVEWPRERVVRRRCLFSRANRHGNIKKFGRSRRGRVEGGCCSLGLLEELLRAPHGDEPSRDDFRALLLAGVVTQVYVTLVPGTGGS